MNDINDEDLRARFDALSEHDAAHAPEFLDVWRRAEARAQSAARRSAHTLTWVAAAASIVAVAGLVTGRTRDRSDTQRAATEVSAISSWQSPTAGLLRTPARDLLAPPPLLSSVFDGVAPAALQRTLD